MKKILLIASMLLLAVAASAQEGRYGMKTGIAKQTMEFGGVVSTQTVSFRNYGEEESTTVTTPYPFIGDVTVRRIQKDNHLYQIDSTRNETSAVEVPFVLDFLHLTPEMIEEFKIEEVGQETYIGKKCTVYSFEYKQTKRRTAKEKAWVYKGFPLRYEVDAKNGKTIVETVDFKENVKVDPKAFEMLGEIKEVGKRK